MAKIIGIDVSEHNGTLDWAKIKAAGIGFTVIRSGYGTSHIDKQFGANIAGAIANGIPIGIYHFSYALTAEGAKKEAEFVAAMLNPYRGKIVLPVFFDFEYDTVDYAKKQGVTLGAEAFNAHTAAFCEAIAGAGFVPGVYYNLDYLRRYVDKDRVGKYVQWYAQYASKPSTNGWAIWQYSSSYTIPGVSGRFDANQMADDSMLTGGNAKYTIGWKKDSKGWWYADTANSYYRDRWAKIDGKWYYFDSEGYMMMNAWKTEKNDTYYLGEDGAMVTNMMVGIGADGRLQPMERYYHLLKELPTYYRQEMDKLIDKGKVNGKSGSGDELVLDLPESAVRTIIICNRE